MTPTFLQLVNLNLGLGKFCLKDINLSCGRGEYHVLLGPTGSGKSTLMKCVLGFYPSHGGAVFLNGQDVSRRRPEERRIGYVPQNYSLFPHLDVEKNIRFGLHGAGGADADRIVDRLCDILGINGLRSRAIANLSGGERQKVALARALAIAPDMVCLDEPFSSIDEGAKRLLWVEMKKIIQEIGITAFHITHNLEEAYNMGERLSVLLDGQLHQSGPKQEIFERPATCDVARFLNYRNIFTGTAHTHSDGTRIDTDRFSVVVSKKIAPGTRATFCVRQQDIKILKPDKTLKPALSHNRLSGRIVSVFPFPEYCMVCFQISGSSQAHDLEIKLPPYLRERHDLYEGKEISVAFWEPSIILFDGSN
ncbi:MAG: ABC transporter ATP-binding protein [Thermodesulfobacteriota bacterium]|nr:ABC transporter ATP-binding protein [Thermodesulfobacteriota bacterium]